MIIASRSAGSSADWAYGIINNRWYHIPCVNKPGERKTSAQLRKVSCLFSKRIGPTKMTSILGWFKDLVRGGKLDVESRDILERFQESFLTEREYRWRDVVRSFHILDELNVRRTRHQSRNKGV